MDIEILNKKIIEIFETSPIDNIRVPWLFTELNSDSILFIGSNPSFYGNRETHKKQIKERFKLNDDEVENFELFKYFERFNQYHKELFKEWRSYLSDDRLMPYFARFDAIAKYIDPNLEWEHIDLYYIRETNQNNLKVMRDKFPDFFNRQLEFTLEVIEKLNPIILVIANGLASRIFKNRTKIQFNNEIGTYEYLISNKKIPVFLSGMLSGQHALDLGSLERLQWHIKEVYKTIKKT